jgi:hypothetical protein
VYFTDQQWIKKESPAFKRLAQGQQTSYFRRPNCPDSQRLYITIAIEQR